MKNENDLNNSSKINLDDQVVLDFLNNDSVITDYICWIRKNAGIPADGFDVNNPIKQQVLDNKDTYKTIYEGIYDIGYSYNLTARWLEVILYFVLFGVLVAPEPPVKIRKDISKVEITLIDNPKSTSLLKAFLQANGIKDYNFDNLFPHSNKRTKLNRNNYNDTMRILELKKSGLKLNEILDELNIDDTNKPSIQVYRINKLYKKYGLKPTIPLYRIRMVRNSLNKINLNS